MKAEYQVAVWTLGSIFIFLSLAYIFFYLMREKEKYIKDIKDRMDMADKIFYIIYEISTFGFCTWEFCDGREYKRVDWDTSLDSLGIGEEELSEILDELKLTFGIEVLPDVARCWITAGEVVNCVKDRFKYLPV